MINSASSGLGIVPANVPPELVIDFDLYNPPCADEDFHLAWKRLQDSAPDIIWTPRNGGHWMALRGQEIHAFLSDYEHFSSRVIIVPKERGDKIKVLPTTLDPPAHRPYRALLNAGLSPKAIQRVDSEIRQLVSDTIESFRTRGACDFISEFAEILPISIFMQMVDLPVDDAKILKPWADQINRPDGTIAADEVMALFANYLRPYIVDRQTNPSNDMLSQMVNGEVNGRHLTESEALEISTQVLIGGMDTVVSFLGFMMIFLARNPGHREQLQKDKTLIPSAVDEFLRRFPIVANGRVLVKDYLYKNLQFREGDMMILPNALHGLDEREHPDPLKVDFHRQTGEHSTFGNGAHKCPGAYLARTELRITLEEWMSRIPDFSIDPAKQIVMCGGIVGTVLSLPLKWDTP